MPSDETAQPQAAAPRPRGAPTAPVRVLHVLGYAGVSGAHAGQTGVERVVEQLLDGLQGFEQSVVYPAAGALLSRYRELAKHLLVAEPAHRFDRGFVAALSKFIEKHDIELVVSHGFIRTDLLTAWACRRTRRPHVVSRAVPLADEGLSRLRYALYAIPDAWTLRHCACVIACSRATRQRMIETQSIAPSKISVIPNGVQLPRVDANDAARARAEMGVGARATIVGAVGQLIPRKRFADLVRAVALVRNANGDDSRDDDIVCVILGEGPERDALQAQARRARVPLHLPGFVAQPWSAIATFDVAVLPSRAEGMPLSVLEAMALGVPPVATSVAGTPEVIENGQSGYLYPVGDVEELARYIGRLCADADERARVGANAVQRVENEFSLAATLRGFERCLRDLVPR